MALDDDMLLENQCTSLLGEFDLHVGVDGEFGLR
jgi:hypothetical protein